MGDTLRSNPPLRRMLGAWLQSCVGTGAGYVALLLLTRRHLGSSWAIAVVLLCDFLPYIAFGSWFGALADRHSRRLIVVVACAAQAAAFAGLLFAHSAATIFPLALLAGIGNALQRPALRSALPVVAGDDAQIAAALYDTSRWVGVTLGPALAAGLFALWGVGLPLALNALSFVVAAAVLVTVPMERPPAAAAEEEDQRERAEDPGGGVRAGLAVAFAVPGIAIVIACSAGSIIAGGLLNVSEPILATGPLRSGGSGYALLVAAYGVGMVVASVLVARRGSRARGHAGEPLLRGSRAHRGGDVRELDRRQRRARDARLRGDRVREFAAAGERDAADPAARPERGAGPAVRRQGHRRGRLLSDRPARRGCAGRIRRAPDARGRGRRVRHLCIRRGCRVAPAHARDGVERPERDPVVWRS